MDKQPLKIPNLDSQQEYNDPIHGQSKDNTTKGKRKSLQGKTPRLQKGKTPKNSAKKQIQMQNFSSTQQNSLDVSQKTPKQSLYKKMTTTLKDKEQELKEKKQKKKDQHHQNSKNKKKIQNTITDFIMQDIQGRNMLDRQVLQQLSDTVRITIVDYIIISEPIIKDQEQKKLQRDQEALDSQNQYDELQKQQNKGACPAVSNCCHFCKKLVCCIDKEGKTCVQRLQKFNPAQRLQDILDGTKEITPLKTFDYVNEPDLFQNNTILMACIRHYKTHDYEKPKEGEKHVEEKNDMNKSRAAKKINQDKQDHQREVEHNKLETLKHLMRFGGKIDLVNKRTNWSVFHWLAQNGDSQAFEFMLKAREFYEKLDEQSQDINHKDNEQYFKDLEEDQKQMVLDQMKPAVDHYFNTQDSYNEFLPDFHGDFPIDLAGQHNHEKIVEIMIDRTTEVIEDYFNQKDLEKEKKEKEKKEKEKNKDKDKNKDKEKEKDKDKDQKDDKKEKKPIPNNRLRFILSPLYLSRCIFWACHCGIDKQRITQFLVLMEQKDGITVYIQAPMPSMHNQTAIHSVCYRKEENILEYFINTKLSEHSIFIQKLQEKARQMKNDDIDFNAGIHMNDILILSEDIDESDSKYEYDFQKAILDFARWEYDYILNFNYKKSKKNKWFNYLDHQDTFGNTPLHLACINGSDKCAEVLLQLKFDTKYGANIELENQEGFRPKDLIQYDRIEKIFNQYYQQTNAKKINKEQVQQLQKEVKKDCEFKDVIYNNQATVDLFSYQVFIPDFVIQFKIKSSKKQTNECQQKFHGRYIDGDQLNRMNNHMSLLIENKFDTYLLKGVERDTYYILISCSESKLQQICAELQWPVKLLDSYDSQTYDIKDKNKFEPFRSKQRQQLIEEKLKENIPLEDLKKNELIIQFYKMHTYGGLAKIKTLWMESGKFYWPYPLNKMGEYLRKGQGQNFQGLTYMRQYLGEKITYFFAWKSFLTCTLVFLAFPGLAFQIYIIITGIWNHWLLPFWVFYVTLWNTIIVEYWKRKTAEINYRWGPSQLMNIEGKGEQKKVRYNFVGDECISDVTGEITKHQKQSKTWLYLACSLPILGILMGLVVVTFIGVEYFKTQYPGQLYQIIAGGLQGVSIVVLNIVYQLVVDAFAVLENHKYEEDFEYFMIYKQIIFKLLNSFFSIFYKAFQHVFEGTTSNQGIQVSTDSSAQMFQTLFFMLLPIMVIKQINYMLLQQWVPMGIYKYNQKQYFDRVQQKHEEQTTYSTEKPQYLNQKNEIDFSMYPKFVNPIERFYRKFAKEKEFLPTSIRCVLGLSETTNKQLLLKQKKKQAISQNTLDQKKSVKFQDEIPGALGNKDLNYEENINQNASSYSISQIKNCEVDSIELNSIRKQFPGMIEHYADGFVDLGYISLFAAAFPLGPLVSLIANILEIRAKIYVFTNVYQRPTCESCNGIGEWLNIWEFMTFFGILTNFALLYFHETDLFQVLFGDNNNFEKDETQKLWFFLFLIGFLILFRKFLEQTISDKPPWILEEEERKTYEYSKKREEEDKLQKQQTQKYQILQKKLEQDQKDKERQGELQLRKMKAENKEFQQQKELYERKVSKKSKQLIEKQTTDLKNIQKKTQQNKTQFEIEALSALRQSYIAIERELLIMRMEQVSRTNEQNIFLCSECFSKTAMFECLHSTCNQNFCVQCFKKYHQYDNFVYNLGLNPGEKHKRTKMQHDVKLLIPNLDLSMLENLGINIINLKEKKKVRMENFLDNKEFEKYQKQLLKEEKEREKQEILEQREKQLKEQQEKQNQDSDKDQGKEENKKTANNNKEKSKKQLKKKGDWKKFEYFSLPTYKQGKDFQELVAIFDFFREEYITQNGIDIENKEVNLSQYLKITKIGDNWIRENSSSFDMIIGYEEFNIEDKIFLNRIAYLTFKRNIEAQFTHFLKYCSQLQDGLREQKLLILIDLIDEDDDQTIAKEEVKKIFLSSFLQDTQAKFFVNNMIKEIFGNEYIIERKDLTKLLLNKEGFSDSFISFINQLIQQND